MLSESLGYGLCPYDYWIDGKKYSGYWASKVINPKCLISDETNEISKIHKHDGLRRHELWNAN